MKELSETEFWIAIGLAFVVGYVVVSFISRLMKTEPPPPPRDTFHSRSMPAAPDGALASTTGQIADSEEPRRSLELLGLSDMPSLEQLEQAYSETLAKYLPENVAHLDDEFRQLAQRKRGEIDGAYTILRAQLEGRRR